MLLSVVVCVPGTVTDMVSTLSAWVGAGSISGRDFSGRLASTASSRVQACRAATNTRQLPIATSIGASARDAAIEQAMMAPADISPLMVRYAPMPSNADCSIMRNTRDTEDSPPTTSLSRSLASRCWLLATWKRRRKRWPKPMACKESAFCSQASAMAQRCLAAIARASPGFFIMRSVSSATDSRKAAPNIVIQPSTGCRMNTKTR